MFEVYIPFIYLQSYVLRTLRSQVKHLVVGESSVKIRKLTQKTRIQSSRRLLNSAGKEPCLPFPLCLFSFIFTYPIFHSIGCSIDKGIFSLQNHLLFILCSEQYVKNSIWSYCQRPLAQRCTLVIKTEEFKTITQLIVTVTLVEMAITACINVVC